MLIIIYKQLQVLNLSSLQYIHGLVKKLKLMHDLLFLALKIIINILEF
jgi:hypothetical protein